MILKGSWIADEVFYFPAAVQQAHTDGSANRHVSGVSDRLGSAAADLLSLRDYSLQRRRSHNSGRRQSSANSRRSTDDIQAMIRALSSIRIDRLLGLQSAGTRAYKHLHELLANGGGRGQRATETAKTSPDGAVLLLNGSRGVTNLGQTRCLISRA